MSLGESYTASCKMEYYKNLSFTKWYLRSYSSQGYIICNAVIVSSYGH